MPLATSEKHITHRSEQRQRAAFEGDPLSSSCYQCDTTMASGAASGLDYSCIALGLWYRHHLGDELAGLVKREQTEQAETSVIVPTLSFEQKRVPSLIKQGGQSSRLSCECDWGQSAPRDRSDVVDVLHCRREVAGINVRFRSEQHELLVTDDGRGRARRRVDDEMVVRRKVQILGRRHRRVRRDLSRVAVIN